MTFTTFEFFLFFAVVLILNWYLKRWPLIWRLFLFASSYYFYSILDVRFLLIIFGVSVFNFFAGKFISEDSFKFKKILFIYSIAANLLVLGLFKYYDFFRVSIESFLGKMGLAISLPVLAIILPVGLSFYIFRTISYIIDVYRKKIKPCKSILDFSIYVAFFPQLLSGPISRADEFLPQLENGGAKEIDNLYGNVSLVLLGLFKKLVISSYLALNLTDDVFAVPQNHSSLAIFLAIFAYSLVIYFDFSGYTDLAIGFAGLMGFKSPINFNMPYMSQNIQDFWRRWHITLSNWVRDYIYIPLGGSRKGKIRQYLNLMITMILVGLWHGSATHFIFWGFLQGIGLAVTHIYSDRKKEVSQTLPQKKWKNILNWSLTFNFISFSWIFFRSETFGNGIILIKNLFNFGKIVEPFQIYIIAVMALGFLLFLFEKQITKKLTDFQQKLSLFPWITFVILAIILLFELSPDILPSFIYFSF
ncbi:MAG: MBOAT family protein [Candidatus Pacebacteria bacterium]|nr:MBOAT family protein [Candidatus Paceibacterota bacterium]